MILERTFPASAAELWTLWTTPAGMESWWGPQGFSVTVRAQDLRAGGVLQYAMVATGPDQVAFMNRAGMPLITEARITYVDVEPARRLRYVHLVDFAPGVAPYDVGTLVELFPVEGGVRMVLTVDPMHDETWSQRAAAGWHEELGKLAALINARRG